jgi:asparagine synthase (glutamine-hydrolysing)
MRQKLLRSFLGVAPDIESIYFDNFAVFPLAMQADLLSNEAVEQIGRIDPYAGVRTALAETDAESLLDRLLYTDIKTYLHELLMKQDQMSMATSVESRVPFLDHKLVEFACSLPERMKLRGLETKYILREAMKGELPGEIVRRKKMGFPVPVGAWLRGPFRHVLDEYVLSERAMARGIFNEEVVHDLVLRHAAGEDHAERLWSLINFEIWQRRFLDGEAVDENESEFDLMVSAY